MTMIRPNLLPKFQLVRNGYGSIDEFLFGAGICPGRVYSTGLSFFVILLLYALLLYCDTIAIQYFYKWLYINIYSNPRGTTLF